MFLNISRKCSINVVWSLKSCKAIQFSKYLSNYQIFTQASRKISTQNESLKKSTVDISQVEVLNKFKDEWWDPNGSIRPLHAYNEIRVPFIRDGFLKTLGRKENPKSDYPLQGTRLLEIGCGGGILTEPLARLGGMVVGLDASDVLIESAMKHSSLDDSIKNNLSYIQSTIEEHAIDFPEAYDIVVVSEVIEHIPEKELFVRNCCNVLKPGGSMFITTFSRTAYAWFLGIFIAEYVLKCIPKGTHEFRLFISPEDTSALLDKSNCKTVATKGISYNFMKNKWSWVNHKKFSYGLHAVKQ